MTGVQKISMTTTIMEFGPNLSIFLLEAIHSGEELSDDIEISDEDVVPVHLQVPCGRTVAA